MYRKTAVLFIVMALLSSLLTGCGAGAASEEMLTSVIPNFEAFSLRLPRLYVQYVETGQGYAEPSLWGLRASLIESWFGLDLSMVKIPDFYVDWLKASDVQHIELVHGSEGLFVYVNGKPMPYVAWDGDSISLVGELAQGLGVGNGDLIRRVAPLLRRIGLSFVIVLPPAEGATFIAYRNEAAGLMASTAAPEIVDPEAALKLQVAFDDAGVPALLGVSADALQPILGFTPGQLDPSMIAQLKQMGVGRLAVQTQGNGLFIRINERALPHVAWSPEHLANALDLYAQMNAVSWVPNEAFVSMVRDVVLQVTSSDINLVVELP